MNEIEKMYENANIKAKEYCDRDSDACMTCCPEWENRQDCWKYKSVMPPFTAEKQIELIKLLSYYYDITISKNFENDYKFQCEGDDVRPYVFTSGQGFAEQLAVFVNMCFEYLPEEEREQIKEILE